MIIQHKRLYIILLAALSILLIPLLAMQFTAQVNWTLSDFVVAGALLLATGLLGELILRKVTKTKYRIALGAALLIGFMLIWAELAVGIFGSLLAGQ